jgi:hypothetical protein
MVPCTGITTAEQAEGGGSNNPNPGILAMAHPGRPDMRHSHPISDLAACEGWPAEGCRVTLSRIAIVGEVPALTGPGDEMAAVAHGRLRASQADHGQQHTTEAARSDRPSPQSPGSRSPHRRRDRVRRYALG